MEFKTITISLAEHIIDKLQDRSDKTGQKVTDIIRQAIFEFLYNTCPIIYNLTEVESLNDD